MFRNNGSGFVDAAVELGINTPGRASNEGGVGCAIGDLNNDGFLDVFVPNYGRNALWLGQPGGRFVACAAAAGVDIDNHAVGAAIGDLDNDGRMDLSVMAYHGVPGAQVPEHQLFHNQGSGRLRNVLAAGSPLNAGDHGMALVDFDGDGGLDLSITKGYNRIGGHFLFRSGLPPRRARQSLQVIVLDAGSHHREAGAEVRVFAPNGRLIGTAQVHTGGGYGVQHAMPVHFGLGSVRHVTVEVTFMHKSGRKVQRITNVRPAVRPIIVRRNPA